LEKEINKFVDSESARSQSVASNSSQILQSPQAYAIYLRSDHDTAQNEDRFAATKDPLNDQTLTFLGDVAVPAISRSPTAAGELDHDPYMNTNLDWALVQVHDPRFMVPNTFSTGPADQTNLIVVTSITKGDKPPKGKIVVAALTGPGEEIWAHGSVTGFALPGSQKMQEVWAIDYKCGMLFGRALPFM
jgi:hypothetical protein